MENSLSKIEIRSNQGKLLYASATAKDLVSCVEEAVGEGISLYDADLFMANLEKAQLAGADLSFADLRGANLYRANLNRADLRKANLTNAVLRKADLRCADMQGTILEKANLLGADLSGANLDFASWYFSCESFDCVADERLAAQLAYHFCRIKFPSSKLAQKAQKSLKNLANKFHRTKCKRIK